MIEGSKDIEPDPVIEFYKRFVDRAAIRENLRLTVEQRLDKLMREQRLGEELRSTSGEDPDRGD